MDTMIERRQHRRQLMHTQVGVTSRGRRGGVEGVFETIDISVGGLLLRGDDRFQLGDVLALELPFHDLALRLSGLVVGVREPAGGGTVRHVHIALTGMSPARRDALYRFLDRAERQQPA